MLSDTKIRSLKPSEKAYKVSDDRGLYLLVNPNGSRWWRFKYYFGGKERGISLGVYPDVPRIASRNFVTACLARHVTAALFPSRSADRPLPCCCGRVETRPESCGLLRPSRVRYRGAHGHILG